MKRLSARAPIGSGAVVTAQAQQVRPTVTSVTPRDRARWPMGLAWVLLAAAVISALANVAWQRGWADWMLVGGMCILAGLAMLKALQERHARRAQQPD
ncbi:hypothetical protein [Geodermatophilus sp. FMUSA9-8]|uniref:hypothetical protein n=1 Tax=Geodermatophilus sp. FMUSA9-8 TaxID=3120155 RepID=UPI0030092EA5